MKVIYQSFMPKITVSAYSDGGYSEHIVFGATSTANKNLVSYTFSRSLYNLTGTFSFSFKEDTKSDINILDSIKMLDLVKIYEFEKLVFIGIVTETSFSASSGNIQKTVSVSGKSIEYLFELLQVSLDITAMNFVQSDAKNIELINELNKKDSTDGISIAEAVKTAFSQFVGILNDYKEVSTVQVLEMLKAVYGGLDIAKFLVCGDINFYYPISSNLYSDRNVKFIDFLRNVLPSPVYEIYGTIGSNDTPKLNLREVPFSSSDWDKLSCYRVPPELLTSYTFSKNCTEVYTEFLGYVEGSLIDPAYYKKLTATDKGYDSQVTLPEKIAVYGYKPLEVTFVGYFGGKNKTEENKTNETLKEKMKSLNTKLSEWFGKLDEMYSGNITIVNADYGNEKTGIGERVMVGTNEFYINAEKHDWAFCAAPTITYTVDRGGRYTKGVFSECINISKAMGEFEK